VPAESRWSQEPEKPIGEQPKQAIPEPTYPFGKVEPVEISPVSRLFLDMDEEEERKSHVGLILVGILVLLAGGVYVAARQHLIQIPWPLPGVQQSAPIASQRSPQTQAAPEPQDSNGAPPADQTASPSQTPETQSAAATVSRQPEAQPPASSSSNPSSSNEPKSASAEKPAAPSAKVAKPESNEAAKADSAPPKEESSTPVTNADGAVLKRVLPNVSPGAIASMRGPVEVEIRVSVNKHGAVSNAEYMTQGPGNYFARTAREAARSWKFTPPQREGEPQASVWNLRFRFERRNTDVTATEIR
jgi:TonB family protein